MPAQTTPFKEIRFTGGRFGETIGWLDVDVLSELQFYRKLILTVAGERWRQQNPGRERLPKGFADSFRLGISAVGAGSAVAVMQRVMPSDTQLPLPVTDDFTAAAQIIDDTLQAVRDGEQFPAGLATAILPMFLRWGKTLRPDESMVFGGNERAPAFNAAIRGKLLERIPGNEPYIDELDLTGEVRAAELNNKSSGSFRIRLDSGDSVPGDFTDEQETSIIEALHDHSEVRLRFSGQGRFEPSGRLQRIIRIDSHEAISVGKTPFGDAAQPVDGAGAVLKMFDEIHRSMPEDAFDGFPTDASANLKHYLYGWPKEAEE